MIVTSSLIQYNTSDIKRALDTKITEFSNDGYYDYLPFPSYTFELPDNSGPFWKRDALVVKWDYSEPLDNLIPISQIYLVSASSQKFIRRNVKTSIKNINWKVPQWTNLNTDYYLKISTMFEGEEIYATSSIFTVDERYIDITTDAPNLPIIANEGNKFTVDWNSHGTSDYVKIEMLGSLEQHQIIIDDTLGRLIGNPAGNQQYVQQNMPPLNGDPPNPVVIKVLEPKKYIGNDSTYTWTVNDIPPDVLSVRLKITDSYHAYVYDYTPPIELKVPYIAIRNFMGRRIGEALVPEVTYSGTGDALLTVYGFDPIDRIVEQGNSLVFMYNSTNAMQVYLTKQSKPNYSLILPLDGTHVITNVQESDVFTVNAKDANNGLRMATFNVELFIEQTTNQLGEFTLLQVLNYSIGLGEEALTSGDALIEPGAMIFSKISYYKTEASQMTEATDYAIVSQLLTRVNEDIIVVLYNGVTTSPKVYLGPGNLRNRVINANIEIASRLGGDPTVSVAVSGKITSGSLGIAGVNIHFDSEGGDTETLIDGTYIKQVPALYSGSAVPSLIGYTFTPVDKSYVNLRTDLVNQNYTAQRIGPPPPPPLGFVITTNSLPNAYVRPDRFLVPYLARIRAANGIPPYDWEMIDGILPGGLSFYNGENTASIAGEPSFKLIPGQTYSATYRVTDSNNSVAEKTLGIKIAIQDIGGDPY